MRARREPSRSEGKRAPRAHQIDLDRLRACRAKHASTRVLRWSSDFENRERESFRSTGNPLHIWNVIGAATGSNGLDDRFPIPIWCQNYLAEVAARMEVLAVGLDCRVFVTDGVERSTAISPKQATEITPYALGLQSEGWNAFDEVARSERAAHATYWYDNATTRGLTERQACEFVRTKMRERGDAPPAGDRSIHAWVRKGRTARRLSEKV